MKEAFRFDSEDLSMNPVSEFFGTLLIFERRTIVANLEKLCRFNVIGVKALDQLSSIVQILWLLILLINYQFTFIYLFILIIIFKIISLLLNNFEWLDISLGILKLHH